MFQFSGIAAYHEQLRLQQTSCVAAVTHYVQRIEARQPLNAFVEVFASEAMQRAAELDSKRAAGHPMGKMHGVVLALKDVICYKGHRVTAASAILKGFESLYNASAVQFLLDEDAIIIGNCNCDEFAMGSTNEHSVYGPTLNAIDTGKVPGGSSGGSAVAVQAGMCMLSLGSDTGGSVRQPADFCGIVGLKPGYGTVSRYGLIAYASSFDQIGVFGLSVEDVALVLEVIARPDEYDSTMEANPGTASIGSFSLPESKKFRIAYFPEALHHPSLDTEIAKSLETLINDLQTQGHTVEPTPFSLIDYIVPAYYVLTTAEASSNLARYDGIRYGTQSETTPENLTAFYLHNRTAGFGEEVKKRIMLGTFVLSTGFYDAYYQKAQQVRRLLCDQTALIFKEYDAILIPTTPATAFPIGQKDTDPIAMYLADIFTVFANLTGLPAISIPLFKHSNGLPFGAQLLTNKQDEVTLLQISAMLMQQKKPAGVSVV